MDNIIQINAIESLIKKKIKEIDIVFKCFEETTKRDIIIPSVKLWYSQNVIVKYITPGTYVYVMYVMCQ